VTPRSIPGQHDEMTDGQTVSLEDGTKAQVKQVKVSSWQTVLVAIALPEPVKPTTH
jgi:hypothetical protein